MLQQRNLGFRLVEYITNLSTTFELTKDFELQYDLSKLEFESRLNVFCNSSSNESPTTGLVEDLLANV